MHLIVSKFRTFYYLAICNDAGEQLDIDDEAHNGITTHAEILARADVLRAATGWPIEDLTV